MLLSEDHLHYNMILIKTGLGFKPTILTQLEVIAIVVEDDSFTQ